MTIISSRQKAAATKRGWTARRPGWWPYVRGMAVAVVGAMAVLTSVPTLRSVKLARARSPTSSLGTVPDFPALFRGGFRFGPPNSKAAIVVFNDYQCPACRSLSRRLYALLERRAWNVSVIVRQFPLPTHTVASDAARLALCGATFGKFRALHDVLLANAESLGRRDWLSYAALAGIRDTAGVTACLASDYPDSALAADSRAGSALRISVSPTFIVNGEIYDGVPWDLERIVKRHLGR